MLPIPFGKRSKEHCFMIEKSHWTDAPDVRLCGTFFALIGMLSFGALIFMNPELHGINSQLFLFASCCLAISTAVFGVGMFFLRKWAALSLSVISVALAFYTTTATIFESIPSTFLELMLNLLIGIPFVLCFLSPAWATYRSWRFLR